MAYGPVGIRNVVEARQIKSLKSLESIDSLAGHHQVPGSTKIDIAGLPHIHLFSILKSSMPSVGTNLAVRSLPIHSSRRSKNG